jgi:hypothetical protein
MAVLALIAMYREPTCSSVRVIVMHFQHDVGIELCASNGQTGLLKQ